MTPTPHLPLFAALWDAPERGTAEHKQAREDIPAPYAADQQADPARAAREAAFDPFKHKDYPAYVTAWCIADFRWKSGRGAAPPPLLDQPAWTARLDHPTPPDRAAIAAQCHRAAAALREEARNTTDAETRKLYTERAEEFMRAAIHQEEILSQCQQS